MVGWLGGWEVVFCIHLLIASALIYVATVSDGQRTDDGDEGVAMAGGIGIAVTVTATLA